MVCLVEKMSSERVKRVIDTVTRLQEFVNRICQLDVDETEYAYLKSLILFSPGEGCTAMPLICSAVQCRCHSSRPIIHAWKEEKLMT